MANLPYTITDTGQNTATAWDYLAAQSIAWTFVYDSTAGGTSNTATITDSLGATVATLALTHS